MYCTTWSTTATRRYKVDLAVQKRVYLAWRDRPRDSKAGVLVERDVDAEDGWSELRKRRRSW